jgi:hypothetical protein
MAPLTTDTSGSATFSITIPTTQYGGQHTLWATDSATPADSAQSNPFNIDAVLTFASGQSFTSLPATLTGGSGLSFDPNSTLTFYLDGPGGTVLTSSPATVTADANGSASFTVTIPSGVGNSSTHTVVAVDTPSPPLTPPLVAQSAPSNTFAVVVPKTCTISPTGISYISGKNSAKGTNFGGTMLTNPVGPINALVQFGVKTSNCAEGGTLPSNATVTVATLALTGTAGRTIGVALVGCSWSQSTVTWNSASTTCGSPMTSPSGTNTTLLNGSTVTWSVLSDVQAIVSGAAGIDGGWVLWDTGTGNNSTSFTTSGSGGPQLTITYH